MRRLLPALLALALAAGPALATGDETRGGKRVGGPAPTAEKKVYEVSHALVIGIDEYQDEAFRDLRGAVNDANEMAQFLKQSGAEVTLLNTPATTTKAKIVEAIKAVGNRVGKDDSFVFYFAGHGTSTGRPKNRMGYLMPIDADPAQPEVNGVEMDWLNRFIDQHIEARHILFVADACFSGLALPPSRPPHPSADGYMQKILTQPARIAFTAGAAKEEVYEYEGHGLLTYHLLEGLKGAADRPVEGEMPDGVITTAELWVYVSDKVHKTAKQKRWKQSPQYGRHGEGELVFRTPRAHLDSMVARLLDARSQNQSNALESLGLKAALAGSSVKERLTGLRDHLHMIGNVFMNSPPETASSTATMVLNTTPHLGHVDILAGNGGLRQRLQAKQPAWLPPALEALPTEILDSVRARGLAVGVPRSAVAEAPDLLVTARVDRGGDRSAGGFVAASLRRQDLDARLREVGSQQAPNARFLLVDARGRLLATSHPGEAAPALPESLPARTAKCRSSERYAEKWDRPDAAPTHIAVVPLPDFGLCIVALEPAPTE